MHLKRISTLGQDPNRDHRINANSFQQNAITTINGWQYAAFYAEKPGQKRTKAIFVNLSRRRVDQNLERDLGWETLTFDDYEQNVDDGHNTISIGVCKGDGTIHVAFDHHCDSLKFRISKLGIAVTPSSFQWDTSLFTKTQSTLLGISSLHTLSEVSYPRFVNIDNDLLFTHRIGKAGLGSDVIYRYSCQIHAYKYSGQHLTGIANSPYVNGMDYRLGRLHISWCYRSFIPYAGSEDPHSTAHKAQAGPNGPENNFGLFYMYSDDQGHLWYNTNGTQIATLDLATSQNSLNQNSKPATILPSTAGIMIFDIPTDSGILNQESQAADPYGGFHVLNREKTEGQEKWILYSRSPCGTWRRTAIHTSPPPTATGARGSLCADRRGFLYAILPGNMDSSLRVLRAKRSGERHDTGEDEALRDADFETVWTAQEGYDGEPLVDTQGLEERDVLSVFTRTARRDGRVGEVVVLDFDIGVEGGRAEAGMRHGPESSEREI